MAVATARRNFALSHPTDMVSSFAFEAFVGVDIAAKTFTAAFALGEGKPKLEKKPFEQDAEGFTRFLGRLAASEIIPNRQLIVMEATGPYWVALAVTLAQAGYRVSVANPSQVHYFAKAQLKRAKSDELDALTLAEFGQSRAMRLRLWSPPPSFYHELCQRISQRESLLKLQNQVENQLHALTVGPVVIESVRTQLEELRHTILLQIGQMDEELKSLIKVELADFEKVDETLLTPEQLYKKNIALLRTIPGIGVMTACYLVLATLNFTTCERAEALVHYAGLAPLEYSSGTSIRGRPSIGHSGNARLRTMLFMATLTAARYNPVIKIFYQRLHQEKHKPSKVARCACARKLIHLAFGIIKSRKPFEVDHLSAKQVAA
jgi:transposase